MQSLAIVFMVAQLFGPPKISLLFNSIECVPRENEDETLINGKVDFGGYGAFMTTFTELNNDFAVLVGGRGGLIINHFFVFGGGGYGLTNEIQVHTNNPPRNLLLDFGYGGVYLEFVLQSRKLVHLSLNALIGAGGADYRTYYYDYLDDDAFFVAEPGAELELNITRHFRMAMGGSYRFVEGINMDGLADNVLSGPAGTLTFKFGEF